MRIAPLVPLVLCLSGTAAFAQSVCPSSAADLQTGIRATFPDFVIDYRAGPDGQVWEHETGVGANDGLLLVSRDNVFLTATYSTFGGRLERGSEEVITYSGGIARVPPLAPDYYWVGSDERTYPDGTTETTELRVTSGPMQTVTLGACTYQGFTVDVSQGPANDAFIDRMLYIPALGIAPYLGGGYYTDVLQESYPTQFAAMPVNIPGLADTGTGGQQPVGPAVEDAK